MAEKVFTKFFENFKGLDLRSSDLTRKPEYALSLKNLILDRTQTLIGRPGFRAAAQHRDRGNVATSCIELPLWGLYNYVGFDSGTGETKEELIGVGDFLYRLKDGSMTVAYGGAGTTATFGMTSLSGVWRADLQVDGVSQAGFPLVLNTNLDGTPIKTLGQLRTAINAVAGFTCTLTPSAVVNGNQVGRDIANPITVNAGHTITISTTKPTTLEFIDRSVPTNTFFDVVAQTGTTLTPLVQTTPMSVNNGDEIGVGLYSALLLSGTTSTSVKPTATFTFPYWEKIYSPNGVFVQGTYTQAVELSPFTGALAFGATYASSPYAKSFVAATDPSFQNLSFATANNTLFIAASNPIDYDQFTGIGTLFTTPPLREGSLLQYDGQQMVEGSLKQALITSATATLGAGLSIGTYKYLARYKFINKQGQYFYGNDSLLLKETTVTTTVINTQVSVVFEPEAVGAGAVFAPANRVSVNGNQVAVTTITVGGPGLRVGDDCCLINRANGFLVRLRVLSVTATTITVNDTVSVNNGDIISNNFTVEIWRTRVFGNLYYLAAELPMPSGATAYLDINADTSLVISYDGPFIGTDRRDSAPAISKIVSHQGALVGIGDRLNPNTVFWSIPGEPGSWPAGTNNVDVNSFVSGPLTAVASDNNNTILAFKKNAYYSIVGDLGTANVTPGSYGEGDVGCESQASLIKVRDSIVFLSNKGPRTITSQAMDGFGDRLVSSFQNNSISETIGTAISSGDSVKPVIARAVTAHDINGQKVLFWVSGETGTPGYSSYNLQPRGTGSLIYVYDYANDVFSEYVFTGVQTNDLGYNMAGGSAWYKGELYFISRFIPVGSTTVRGALYKMPIVNSAQDFWDDSAGYQFEWKPAHDTGGEPSINKEFLRIKVYRFTPNSLSVLNGNSSDIVITTYKDFVDTTPHFTTTMQFLVPAAKEKIAKLKSDKMRVCLFKFSGTSSTRIPVITGYEYVIALPYQKDDLAI